LKVGQSLEGKISMNHNRRQAILQGVGALFGASRKMSLPLAGVAALALPNALSARASDVPYGAAINPWALRDDAPYREALARYCSVAVSESAMKWDWLRPTPTEYNFKEADEFVDFATSHDLAIRGHTLVWYYAIPPWMEELTDTAEVERVFEQSIESVLERYADRVSSWDVVNEPIADPPARGLRDSFWKRHLGDDYISKAFHAARRAAPNAQLVLNEFGIEAADEASRHKRADFLDLVRKLVDEKVPLDAIGIQGHLAGDKPIDRDGLREFLVEVDNLQLKVLITELDVNDMMIPGPPDIIDAVVAARAYEFLEVVFDVVRPESVITWGITDRHTWMPMWFARTDGLTNRCLPLDEDLQEKPFMSVIRHFCRV
jgi:endo-1,4-beta-xylanase